MQNIINEILFSLAEGKLYDSEYDGRMYSYCAFCNAIMEDSGIVVHDEDCLQKKAIVALGETWTDKLAADELAKEEAAQQREANAQAAALARKRQREFARAKSRATETVCEYCGRSIPAASLIDHQRTSIKCKEKQISKLSGIDGKDCKLCITCRKPFVSNNPAHRFCCNTGVNNCKDRYHNQKKKIAAILRNSLVPDNSVADVGHPQIDQWDHGF